MKIIGLTDHIGGVAHDNSAALLVDGEIVFAEAQERVSRLKHDQSFPLDAIKHALKFSKLNMSQIDYFASAIPPMKLFPFLLAYLEGIKYCGFPRFIIWFIKRSFGLLNSPTNKRFSYSEAGIPKEKLICVSHHLAHAESAYCSSGWQECLVVAWDGYGIDISGKPLCGIIYRAVNDNLEKLEEIPMYASLPLYYGAVTIALGFKLNDGEGKTMGLAAFGNPSKCYQQVRQIFPIFVKDSWLPRNNWLDITSVSKTNLFKTTSTYKYLQLLIKEHKAENVAAAAQKVLEEESEKFFSYLVKKYKNDRVAAAGGIFLNVKMNMRLFDNKIVSDLFVYPNPGDSGTAVGAAFAVYKNMGGILRKQRLERADLGCKFTAVEIQQAIKRFKNQIIVQQLKANLAKVVAKKLTEGKVLGWFQGRGEWGPRALGQRSVLADPRYESIKERINQKLKQRDWFMPFAPAILQEKSSEFLVNNRQSPFMITADRIKPNKAKLIPAAIHIDKTVRPQTVNKKVLPLYHQVIEEFYKLTGVPVILNTSFNRHGLPIVHSPHEAIEHLLWGAVDELVIGNYLIQRKSH